MNSGQRLGFGFEEPVRGEKDEWITPRHVTDALGAFDLDPCAPVCPPWKIAAATFTVQSDGLKQNWGGARAFCNPPYGPQTAVWLNRLAAHGNGIALVFARTETRWFQEVAPKASGFLFLAGRLRFHHVDGRQGQSATAPSVLMSFDGPATNLSNRAWLEKCGLPGVFFGALQVTK